MLVRVGFSADPDDAFMFWGLASGTVDPRGHQFEPVIEDIQTLNEWSLEGRLEVTAMSLATYPLVQDRYLLLPHGGSMGSGYGPIVVARERAVARRAARDGDPRARELTTAFLVLKMALGEFDVHRVLPFDEILPAVASGRARAGPDHPRGPAHVPRLGPREVPRSRRVVAARDGPAAPARRQPRAARSRRRGGARGVGDPARVDRRRARAPRGGARVRARLRARHGRASAATGSSACT